MTARSISTLARPDIQRHGAGLTTYDVNPALLGEPIDPFIFVSLYDMAGPTFPPHPHAGFSVATYILPESPVGFINQDSLGNRNRIAPGALHITVAGSGVLHEEQPERTGSIARGFQIWIDHRLADREVDPHAISLRAADVPAISGAGWTAHIVVGEAMGVRSPASVPTPITIIDIMLNADAAMSVPLPADQNGFLFLHGGSAQVSGQSMTAESIARLGNEGDQIAVTGGPGGARFTLFAGPPLTHRTVQRGPFVASDEAQLARFMTRYQTGQFGNLPPIATQPDWAPNDGQKLG